MDDARAGEREMLPGPGRLCLIGFEGFQRIRQRASSSGGPQAHVDLVEAALVGERGQGHDDLLAEACVVLDRRQRLGAVGCLHVGRNS